MLRGALILGMMVATVMTFGQSSTEILKDKNIFSGAEDKGQVEERLGETSGLVASFQNQNCYWTLNDGGNPTVIFLIEGEAICFTNDRPRFYTLSETYKGTPGAQLKFYKRLK